MSLGNSSKFLMVWEKGSVPRNFWNNISNQVLYVRWLSEKLKINNQEDWYKVKLEDFKNHCGMGLIDKYEFSVVKLLRAHFPDIRWYPWKFSKVGNTFWKKIENQKEYIMWLKLELGITEPTQWYKLTTKKVEENFGYALLHHHYKSSVYLMLKVLVPDHEWLPWLFDRIPQNYWKSIENQRKFLAWVESNLELKDRLYWYTVKHATLIQNHGNPMLKLYQDSPYKMLKTVYPDIPWRPWKFHRTPVNIWSELNNVQDCIHEIKSELNINDDEEWYRVSYKQLTHINCAAIWDAFGNLYKPLTIVYPDVKWEKKRFSSTTKKSSQRWLAVCIGKIFHRMNRDTEIIEEYKLSYIKNVSTSPTFDEGTVGQSSNISTKRLELDVYVPEYLLAFEYQGEQHFHTIPSMSTLPELYRAR
eukprot:TRINITY_DN655_c0_g1_i3.p1 TRINITY_DN655_c0_g1~~TRINITY_DN655_c0_g1_i3.p1  ORF type:complete len:416 (-),score=39.96 TRINITY_DN655_c0_g1_i3:123-1370(-)